MVSVLEASSDVYTFVMAETLTSLLDSYLSEEQSSLSDLFARLLESELYIALETVKIEGREILRAASFKRRGSKLLPVFFDKASCHSWSQSRYSVQPIPARELVQTSARSTRFLLQAGHAKSLELSLSQMCILRGESTDLVQGLLRDSLKDILVNYYEVEEAYIYFETEKSSSLDDGAAVGIFAPSISADQRFKLISRIGAFSKEFFGFAGAIEVFDDLDVSNSKSWELFQTTTPFYDRASSKASPLSSRIKTERISLGEPTAESQANSVFASSRVSKQKVEKKGGSEAKKGTRKILPFPRR